MSIGEYSNSSLTIVKSASGDLFYGWGQGARAARNTARDNCMKARTQPLPCTELKTYSALTRQYITPKNLQAARKLYGVGAWLASSEKGYDNRAWFATGHRNLQDAINTAIRACQQAYPGKSCETFAGAGNGFIQAFRDTTQTGAGTNDNGIAETTAKRAAGAAKAACATTKAKCVLQSQFDTRRPGLFVHDFKTGATANGP